MGGGDESEVGHRGLPGLLLSLSPSLGRRLPALTGRCRSEGCKVALKGSREGRVPEPHPWGEASLQVRRAGQGPGPLEIDWGLDTGTPPRTVDLGPGAPVLEECMRCQMFGTPSSEKSILFVFFSRSPYPTRFPVLHQGCDLATRRTQHPWTETKGRVKPPFPLEIPATAL